MERWKRCAGKRPGKMPVQTGRKRAVSDVRRLL